MEQNIFLLVKWPQITIFTKKMMKQVAIQLQKIIEKSNFFADRA